jgi:hypothetical protein
VTMRTDRPPVRPRSGRRPLPPLIFLLVLALAALGVWWYVLRQETREVERKAEACASASEAAPTSLDPAAINLRVFNATDTAGLAQTVATALKERGFVVDEVANDTSGREVTGVGELRHGARGSDAAQYVRLYLPKAGDYLDTRATAVVDVVIGPEFTALASADEVAAALAPATSAAAEC